MEQDRLERRRRQTEVRRRRRRFALVALAVLAAGGVAAFLAAPAGRHADATRPAPRPARRLVVVRHVRPAVHVTRASRDAAVPILMYHVIAPAPAGAPFPGLYVPRPEFAAQMSALVHAGFHAITLNELRRARLGLENLPRRPIVISFDNGYRTQYTEALPVLRRLHWVGDENLQLSGLPPKQGGLTRRDVSRLIRAGWELDTQGYSHADLPALDARGLEHQIDLAVELIRRRWGIRPAFFCYPSGRYDPQVIAAVRAAGFAGATTVVPGWATRSDDPYRLPRLRVLAGTSPAQLLELIRSTRGAEPPPPSY